MLTLDSTLIIPNYISFTTVEEDAILLNTRTNKYFALEKVGARLWVIFKDDKNLRDAFQSLLEEYDVESVQLERDVLELVQQLAENQLVKIVEA